jgi:hypothetical protein
MDDVPMNIEIHKQINKIKWNIKIANK